MNRISSISATTFGRLKSILTNLQSIKYLLSIYYQATFLSLDRVAHVITG